MTSALLAQARALQWRQVPSGALALAKSATDAAHSIREAIRELPQDGFLDIWYSPQEKAAAVVFGSWTSSDTAEAVRAGIATVVPVVDEMSKAAVWVKVATQPPGILYQKRAYSPTVRAAGNVAGFFPDYFGKIPGVPSPLVATLASGALGAGAGYGVGWAAEQVLPEQWKRKRLRNTLAVLGGAAGAVPGAIWGASNFKDKGLAGLVDGAPFDTPNYPQGIFRKYTDNGELLKQNADAGNPFSSWGEGDAGAFPKPIDAEELVRTVYAPPMAKQLSPELQAATAGLVMGAGHLQTGGRHMPRLVSPAAVGNMAAGMGSGWLSGMLVGKVLGALTGMPAPAQKRLQDTGLWAGAIANIVPLAFPNR